MYENAPMVVLVLQSYLCLDDVKTTHCCIQVKAELAEVLFHDLHIFSHLVKNFKSLRKVAIA